MRAKCVVLAVTSLLPLACSQAVGERGGDDEDDQAIVPAGLRVSALPGGNGVLELTALTLRRGARQHELYAALRNSGDVPACHAALSVELYDSSDRSLAAGIAGLLTRDFFRLRDGSGTVAACVSPGTSTLAAITDLPLDFALEDVRTVVYRCPYFALDVQPSDGLVIEDVKRVDRAAGTAYAGKLGNELDVAVSDATVTVFPLNRAGRPLGVATSAGTRELAPGERRAFETNSVSERGADYAAFPAGVLAVDPTQEEVEP